MSARIPPYKNTIGACAFVAVFGPIYNVAAAALWYFLLIALSYFSDFQISTENVAEFGEDYRILIKFILSIYFAIASLFGLLVVALIFRRSNVKVVIIFYAVYSLVLTFLLLNPVPLVGGLWLNGGIGFAITSVMLYQSLGQMAPPSKAGEEPGLPVLNSSEGLPGGGLGERHQIGVVRYVAKDTKQVKGARRLLAWFTIAAFLVFAMQQAMADNYVAAVILLAIGPGLILLFRLLNRRAAANPPTLEIDRDGLKYAGSTLPWADVGQVWVHKRGRIENLRIATSPEAERAFLDKNRAKGRFLNAAAAMVRLKRALMGINSIAIPVFHFEASGNEIKAAIERARPGDPSPHPQAG